MWFSIYFMVRNYHKVLNLFQMIDRKNSPWYLAFLQLLGERYQLLFVLDWILRLFVQQALLEDRDSVFLQSRGQAYLPITKNSRSWSSELCNETYQVWNCHLAPLALFCGKWSLGNQQEKMLLLLLMLLLWVIKVFLSLIRNLGQYSLKYGKLAC